MLSVMIIYLEQLTCISRNYRPANPWERKIWSFKLKYLEILRKVVRYCYFAMKKHVKMYRVSISCPRVNLQRLQGNKERHRDVVNS